MKPQFDENWILGEIESMRMIHDGRFKFVLVEKDGIGYVGFDYGSHRKAFKSIYFDSQPEPDEIARGGGSVRIKDFDNYAPAKDHYDLEFFGESENYGPFDRDLLDRTLSESLSNRFSYEIK